MSIFEFQERFPDDASCLKYLADVKWENGFVCEHCGNTKYCDGNSLYSRRCTKCSKIYSPTSGTIFHKVKFSILKALWIVYYVGTNKKGISSMELSRKLSLRQGTCWFFKQKIMKAMDNCLDGLLVEKVDVDETVVGGQEEGVKGRKNNKKKIVIFAIERNKKKGVNRISAKVMKDFSSKEIKEFFYNNINKEANIRSDGWNGYIPLKKEFKNFVQELSGKKGENFSEMHRVIMMFKGWLRGMHHHVNHLQAYINEYCYRFNNRFTDIFDNLIVDMMKTEPNPYKKLFGN